MADSKSAALFDKILLGLHMNGAVSDYALEG